MTYDQFVKIIYVSLKVSSIKKKHIVLEVKPTKD